jgi:hypothetical protein
MWLMRKHALFLLLVVASLAAASNAAAQTWGRERPPSAGACFYEDINYGGRYFCVRPGEVLRSLPSGMNDRISSIRVYGRVQVTVFRDHLSGRSARFSADVHDLRRQGWNDTISSLEVIGNTVEWHEGGPVWGHGPAPREGACFYRDANYRGESFCVPRGAHYASMPRDFNNAIRSVRVFGGAEVRVFTERDYHGRSGEVRHDVGDLHGTWRDSIESLRVW